MSDHVKLKNPGDSWYLAAAVIGGCGLVPFLVVMLLHSVGAINAGSGLGVGLLLWLCGFIAAVCVVIGTIIAFVSRRGTKA